MIRERLLNVDCLAAARQRIVNIFANGLPVYLSFSGGKDSLVLAHLTMALIEEGAIDKRLLRVEFVDEEAIFPCIERVVMDWRDRLSVTPQQLASHSSPTGILSPSRPVLKTMKMRRRATTAVTVLSTPVIIP